MKLSALALYAQAAYAHPERFFIRRLSDCVIISERGTATVEDFLADLLFIKANFMEYKAHAGFVDRFLEVWPAVKRAVSPLDTVYVTGHSLGGAVATLIAWALKRDIGVNPIVATFGSPRVFNAAGSEAYSKECPNTTRVVHKLDIVPRVPKIDFEHVDRELHLDDDGVVLLSDDHWFKWLLRIFIADMDGLSLDNHHMPSYLKAVFAYEENSPQQTARL